VRYPTASEGDTVRRSVATAGLLVVLFFGIGCAGPAPELPLGPDGQPDPVLVVGQDVFKGRCSTCHGSSGGGGTGKKLNEGVVVEKYPDPAVQAAIITNGLGGSMPAFREVLTPEQIEAVVRYTREVL